MVMNGKGSERRPQYVADDVLAERWRAVFGEKPSLAITARGCIVRVEVPKMGCKKGKKGKGGKK
jgi:hypothetical protein